MKAIFSTNLSHQVEPCRESRVSQSHKPILAWAPALQPSPLHAARVTGTQESRERVPYTRAIQRVPTRSSRGSLTCAARPAASSARATWLPRVPAVSNRQQASPFRARHVATHSFPPTKLWHVSPLVLNPNSFPKNQSKLPDFFPKLNMWFLLIYM